MRFSLKFQPAALTAACVLLVGLPTQQAQAQRTRVTAASIQQQAEAAEARLKSGGDAEAAVHEVEQLMQSCPRVRGCQVATLMPIYKRMLKVEVGGDDPDGVDEGDEDENPINIAGDPVPNSATAEALLDPRNKRFIEQVQFNPAVQAGIRRWLTDMRPALMDSYVNYQYLRPYMAPAFQRAGLPEALLFGIMAKESNGKVHAGSRAGAVGPLQFMPATGRRFGLGPDGTGFDTRYDPQRSSEAAAAYLMERYGELGGSIELALAGYNGGEGRARRVYQQNPGMNFWHYQMYDQFPAETKDYVPMVIAAAWLYLHPGDYGVRFPRTWGAGRPAQITLKRATSLNELSICMGNARGSDGYLRALRNLNPRFQPDSWLPGGGSLTVTTTMASLYNRYCVSGKRAELAQQLIGSHVANAVVRTGPLTQQQATSTAPAPAGSTVQDGTPVPATPVAVPPPAPVPKTPAPATTPKPAARPATHKVGEGETLTAIARRYGCSVPKLIEANGLKAPKYHIQPGQTIQLEGCGG